MICSTDKDIDKGRQTVLYARSWLLAWVLGRGNALSRRFNGNGQLKYFLYLFFYFFLVWVKYRSKGAVYKYTVTHTITNTKTQHLTWEGAPCHDVSMAMVSSNLQYHDFHRSLKCQMEKEISDNTIVVHSGKISDVAVLKLGLLRYFPLLFLPGGHYWKINRGS